jgi:hypothetical protein
LRRHQVAYVVASTRRTYGSGGPSIRAQANQHLANAVCSRSSASPWSPVSRYAVRSSAGDRVATNSSNPLRSAIGPSSVTAQTSRDPGQVAVSRAITTASVPLGW